MQKSILIIDDDNELTSLMDEYLSPQGYRITIANDGEQGLALATGSEHFDLILLDVMMPGKDGFDVLRQLRISHLTPVLMLTARGDDYDRILGLELGADDYLPKPFNHRELSARIKAIVRRMEYMPSANQHQHIRINDVELHPATHSATCDGQEVDLTSTEFSILRFLMINNGQLVSKADISQKVLGKRLTAFDRNIDMHVSNIRKKLGQFSNEEKIKTVRGAGYLYKVAS